MYEKINNFPSILEQAINRNKENREAAAKVFSQLKGDSESELVAGSAHMCLHIISLVIVVRVLTSRFLITVKQPQ